MAGLTGNPEEDFADAGAKPVQEKKKTGLTGNPEEDFADTKQPAITEGQPGKSGDWLTGSLHAAAGLGANLVHGAAEGIQNADREMYDMSQKISPFKAPYESPDIVSPVTQMYGNAMQSGRDENPTGASIAGAVGQGVGSLTNNPVNLAAWEAGAGATGQMLKLAKPAIQASGPIGAALLQGASKIPGAVKDITHMVTTQSGGAMVAGMQQEAMKESKNPGAKPDMLNILKAGFQAVAEAAPIVGGLGVIGEGVAKGLAKAHEMHISGIAKNAAKKAEAMQKLQLKAQESVHAKLLTDLEAQWDQQNAAIQSRQRNYQRGITQDFKNPRFNRHRDNLAQAVDSGSMSTEEANAQLRRMEEMEYAHGIKEQKAKAAEAAKKQLQLRKAYESTDKTTPKADSQARAEHYQDIAAKEAADLVDELEASKGQGATSSARAEMAQSETAAKASKTEPQIPAPVHIDQQADARANNWLGQKKRSETLKNRGLPPDDATIPEQTGPAKFSLSARRDVAVDKSHDFSGANRGNTGRQGWAANNPDKAPPESILDTPPNEDQLQALFAAEPRAKKIYEQMKEEGSIGSDFISYGAGIEGATVAQFIEAVKTLPASELTYDGVMHAAAVQKDTDIFKQYAPDLGLAWIKAGKALSELHGGLAEMFKNTSGKVKFAQMGAGVLDSKLLNKAVRGQLEDAELKGLPEVQQRALRETQRAIQDYVKQAKPIQEWLNEYAKELPSHSGLGRLRVTLNGHLGQFEALPGKTKGNLDKVIDAAHKNSMIWMFASKAANSVIHLAEKSIAMGAREGFGLLGAIAKAAKPGAIRDFVKVVSGDGIITESLEDAGVQVKSGVVGALTGRAIERAPNAVATVIGLDKAAKKFGYSDGETLAEDILAAREGKGPLAYNSDKLSKIMGEVHDYVSDLTGSNAAGFKDRNVFQRNDKTKMLNAFLTMPTVQSRNFHRLIQDLAAAKTPKDTALGATKIGLYLAGLYLVAGDKGAIPKDMEDATRAAVGAPNWYHFMDKLHALRQASSVPAIEHLQQSAVPLISGGASTVQIIREGIQKWGHHSQKGDTFEQVKAAVGPAGMALGAQLFGIGGGTLMNYVGGADDARRGFKMLKIYQHGLAGDDKHIADIPMATNALNSMVEKYTGAEGTNEQDLRYNAEKTMDLRSYCQRHGGEEYKDMLQGEGDLDSLVENQELKQEQNDTLQGLYDAGYAKDSDEAKKVTEEFTKRASEGDQQAKLWSARARYWQDRADEIKTAPEPPPQLAPKVQA